MKRKVATVILSLILTLSLSACAGAASNANAPVETDGEAKETMVDAKETEAKPQTEDDTSEVEEQEESPVQEEEEQPEAIVTWYMDEEGLKSDLLGISIKRSNDIMDDIHFWESMWVYNWEETDRKVSESVGFWCQYYDGDLDSYIAENSAFLKGKIGEIEYAYRDSENFSEIAVVGNGIMVFTNVVGIDVSTEDYLRSRRLFQPCDEFTKDCLAYMTQDGLYCPALGLAVAAEEDGNQLFLSQVQCESMKLPGDISIDLHDESQMGTMYYMADAENAQQVLDNFVTDAVEPDEGQNTAAAEIEGTVEKMIGEYSYLGRGITYEDDWNPGIKRQRWLFYSDDAEWSIMLECNEDESYEACLAALENMQ